MYAFSSVPNQPYLDLKDFPELKVLLDRCDEIREEALRLFGDGHIKASDKYNDAGFNSFFKSGWKRFYLKWYDADHPRPARAGHDGTAQGHPEHQGRHVRLAARQAAAAPPRSYAGSLRMGLITPNSPDCYINVDGETPTGATARPWSLTRLHPLRREQDGSEPDHPVRRRRASDALSLGPGRQPRGGRLPARAAAPNQEGDKTGGINRIFGAVRCAGSARP